MSFESNHLCGWKQDPAEVNRLCQTMPMPLFTGGTPKGTDPVLLYKIYRAIAGADDLAAQGIGDCVSWGWKHLCDYTQCVEIYREINDLKSTSIDLNDPAIQEQIQEKLYSFEMTASEAIYALSRVEVGGQRGSYQDGSVGAWAAKAVTKFGTLSYRELGRLGLGDKYDAKRAKKWGADGLPDELEPDAYKHILATTSLVTNFNDAAHLIENGYGFAVCSNVGFENAGRGSQTLRDKQGFATPRGRWDHCMFGCAVRYDRPGICIINQWPDMAFAGPLDLEQPKNSFWVDEKTINYMLSQQDSFTASGYQGYPLRPLTYRF